MPNRPVVPMRSPVIQGAAAVMDKRTLRGMARQGHLIWPAKVAGREHRQQSYVEYQEGQHPRRFTYRGYAYQIRYVDGAFFPYVFLL